MNKSELLLVSLFSGGNAVYTPVQIQKLMFLIDRNIASQLNLSDKFNFSAYDYGPFDSAIYDELRSLKSLGLIDAIPTNRGWEKYFLTQQGLINGEVLQGRIEPHFFDYIKKVSELVRSLTFRDLVSAIYKKYPEMKVNSVFRENDL
jgi:uncharacterized protein YwgA